MNEDGAGPTSQIGETLYNTHLNKEIRLLCGTYSSTGMKHIARGHPETLYVQGSFERCLNYVIRYTTTSTDGSEPHYQVLKQSYSYSGAAGSAFVVVDTTASTVVTAYVSSSKGNSDALLEASWNACSALDH